MRLLMAVLLMAVAAICVQTWRLDRAEQANRSQKNALAALEAKLNQKNSQLIALNILTQTNSREQTRLYAAAEETRALLQTRQRHIEDLTRENEAYRRWAAAPLPAVAVRLRQRPAITGGQSYRDWLSQNNALPPAGSRPTQ
ncbi:MULTISPECIES: Rz-like lysis system protein LysB [Enterobacterales]|uniref:Rz-like lysis system protein LysB n=1 Tax=Enterobacterales TaxID=91347 RepID=UPI001F51477B|nr:Rz-like lysis system protein LysB [Cronobacter sakazakii]ELY5774797.1 LysB family phage lysis regulatory protein [Cronobacter sakazakii]MCI0193073.1 LysB family phage lysis regulatory protein [Cronobacter sakazakii]MCI0210750.1 LysB family phage lysis regulatory protein [Cronobacter sakazakii]MCI0271377.1 LysB family phage lysis regulatory protein [Cronobacter sakazakii]